MAKLQIQMILNNLCVDNDEILFLKQLKQIIGGKQNSL